LAYHKLYYAYRDSLNSDKIDKKIQQLQFDYELQKKERQIDLLNNNKILAHSRNEKQVVVEWALGCGMLLLIVISVLLYRNVLIEKRNQERIVQQKEEIQAQAAKLGELVRFKDKTFSVLSHDLRGPMGTLTTAMLLLDEYILSPEEFARLKPEINRQISSLNTLLDNLLNWAKSSIKGEWVAAPQPTDLARIVQANVALLRESAERKKVQLEVLLNVPTIVYCDAGQIDIVFRNILSNAIKFTPANGKVTISAASKKNHMIALSVKDTGVGMTKEQIAKLFTAAEGNITYGTEGEKGTGLGLLLCYEFVKSNKGDIYVESEIGKGSNFIFELPDKNVATNA